MKIRTLIVSIVVVLVVTSVSPAQETVISEPESKEPVSVESSPPGQPKESSFTRVAKPPSVSVPRATRTRPATLVAAARAAESPKEVRIFELKHASVMDMSNLISRVFSISVAVDSRLNRLIVNATQEQMDDIEDLIQAMDIPGSEASTARNIQDFVYCIYMFELPSADQTGKPFSMVLRVPVDLPSSDLLVSAKDKGIRISDFLMSDEDHNQENVDIFIQGQAPSDESISEFADLTDGQIRELKWDDEESFTGTIEAAQYAHLPEQMQKHIARLLGDDIRTVGYWFGNLSAPGGVMAPIGPWMMNLSVATESDRMLDFQIDVEIPRKMSIARQPLRVRNDRILSNTLRAKIGKPIIIGYNRESYGTRKMGAMVIIPEADSF